MKLKSLLYAACFSLVSSAFAANHHVHPKANEVDTNKNSVASKASVYPGYCEIEVVNSSYNDLWVYGTFDDGSPLSTFKVYQGDSPHYISLYYNGYCHTNGMRVTVEAIRFPYPNVVIYDYWTPVNYTISIVPRLANGLNDKSTSDSPVRVELSKKK